MQCGFLFLTQHNSNITIFWKEVINLFITFTKNITKNIVKYLLIFEDTFEHHRLLYVLKCMYFLTSKNCQ